MSTPDELEDVNPEEVLRHLAGPRVENAGFEVHDRTRDVEEALRRGDSIDERDLLPLRAAIDDLDYALELLEAAYLDCDE